MSLLRKSFRGITSHSVQFRLASTSTSPIGATISQVAQQEGGTAKGSKSAAMQSHVTRQRNAEQAIQQEEGNPRDSIPAATQSQISRQGNAEQANAEVAAKLNAAPETVTSGDASYAQSREARATGIAHPDGGVAQAAAKQAAINEGDTVTNKRTTTSNSQPSKSNQQQNYNDTASSVETKMHTDPSSVTKEDANTLHSREQRAFGVTQKGGLTSQAHKLASQNES